MLLFFLRLFFDVLKTVFSFFEYLLLFVSISFKKNYILNTFFNLLRILWSFFFFGFWEFSLVFGIFFLFEFLRVFSFSLFFFYLLSIFLSFLIIFFLSLHSFIFFYLFFFYIFHFFLQDWRSEVFLRVYSLRPLPQTSRQQKPQWPGCEDKTKTCPLKTLCIKVASLLKHLNSTWAAAADGSCLSVNITEEWGRSSSVTAPPVCCLLFVLARLKIRDKRKKGVRIVRRMTHLNRLLGTPSAQF